jgi:DNA-binding MarR family transcriptional regulator
MGDSGKVGADESALRAAVEGLQRLADVFELRRRQLAAEAGLSDGQWRVLEEIGRDDFMPSLFARQRDCSPAAVSRTLRQLQERGLVRGSISPADGRQRDYVLTAKGRRLLEKLKASRQKALQVVWSGLPAAEVRRFGQFSGRLAERLERYADEVSGTLG